MAQNTATDLKAKYQTKGAQQVSLQEYMALQEKKAKKAKVALPAYVKFILATPLFILFAFGLFFIPYIIFQAFTSHSSSDSGKAKITSSSKLR